MNKHQRVIPEPHGVGHLPYVFSQRFQMPDNIPPTIDVEVVEATTAALSAVSGVIGDPHDPRIKKLVDRLILQIEHLDGLGVTTDTRRFDAQITVSESILSALRSECSPVASR